jgi:hypothetical protein
MIESNARNLSTNARGASIPGSPSKSMPVDAMDRTLSAKRTNGTTSSRTHTSV